MRTKNSPQSKTRDFEFNHPNLLSLVWLDRSWGPPPQLSQLA